MIVASDRVSGAVFEGIGSGSLPIMAVLQSEEGMAGPGNSAESPTNRCSKQGRYARYGSAASANILCRALSSNSYEGWPRARRMINPPGVTHHTAR